MTLLKADGLTKSFYNGDLETVVLKGIDLALEPGEMVALQGPSGSGKSTLLNILGLLMQPTGGTLSFIGDRVSGLSEKQLSAIRNRHFGFVFQFHNLLPDFTAVENVAFPAAAPAGGISKAMRERAKSLLERVDLSDRLDYAANRLSGGQKQRVAVARALMNRPQLVFADEPTGSLDQENGARVMQLLREINREDKTTFLISTHDPDIAAICDRQINVVDGRIA
ncbi:ABC transporter ATP-binding protein [Parasphingorhabdus sp. NYA22]